MLSACLSKQASSKLILTPSRHPPCSHWWLSLWATIPLQPGLRHAHLHAPAPRDSPINRTGESEQERERQRERMTGITASAALIISFFFNEGEVEGGRPGGTATQNKSDYSGTVCFSFQALHLSPFCLLWNNFPAPLRKAQTLVFSGVCFCSKSLFALFCTSRGSFSGGWR